MNGTHQTPRPGSAFEIVLDALHAARQMIRPRGPEAFMASCPLHADHTPSLSVRWRDNTRTGHSGGVVLLHCFSCQAPAVDITTALGIRTADLFDNPAQPAEQRTPIRRTQPTGQCKPSRPAGTRVPLPARVTITHDGAQHAWRPVRTYTYTTINGAPIQQVIRQECSCNGQPHKRFCQRYRDGRRWVYRKPQGFTAVLYRLTAIRTAATTHQWIWITEGEKDADTLTALGRLATTNAQGAASFPEHLIPQFRGLKVAIAVDRDLAGYQRAIHLYQQLHHSAAQIAILLPGTETDKSDVTDHVDAGLWQANEPFGGLASITVNELHALALLAAARRAADRLDIALAEARAHQSGTLSGNVRAAGRWLTEASEQLLIVQCSARNLLRHNEKHPSPITSTAADTAASLCDRLESDYHRCL
ncbi:MAG: hypothetical protein K2Q25_15715 [Mycobacteriaceae bacterium]|nr:hypothetical protein [Mycobacteriaceae bacterium]